MQKINIMPLGVGQSDAAVEVETAESRIIEKDLTKSHDQEVQETSESVTSIFLFLYLCVCLRHMFRIVLVKTAYSIAIIVYYCYVAFELVLRSAKEIL